MQSMESSLKDKEGTIETLERQLVQAGIKGKVMQAEMEITKKKEQEKANVTVAAGKVKNDQTTQQQKLAMQVANEQTRMKQSVDNIIRKVETEKDNVATNE